MELAFSMVAPQLRAFLAEDIGSGDLTASITKGINARGTFTVKQAGTVAGLELPGYLYRLVGDRVDYQVLVQNGTAVAAGTVVATASGPLRDLLMVERVALNLVQRMSGVATATSQAVCALAGSKTQVLDTRKTVPGLRLFDKAAVRTGCGVNHRMGLFDCAMLKDNHLATIDNLPAAVARLRRQIGPTKTIEVEVASEIELHAAIASDVDIIMIDNQIPSVVAAWAKQVPSQIKTEASGNIHLQTVSAYGQTGVDYVSIGSLTNGVSYLDVGFDIID